MLQVCFDLLPPPKQIKPFQQRLHTQINVCWNPSDHEDCSCQVLVSGRPSPERLKQHPELTHLLIPFSGVPEETRHLLMHFPNISVHNIHYNDSATAEMALTLLLAAAKFLLPMDHHLRQNDWSARYEPPSAILLAGRTALVLGLGAIGQRVARLCIAMDMKVLGTRKSIDAPYTNPNGVIVYPASNLKHLLPQAQVLFITLPLTPETKALLGESELALLPANSVLVNVGRGAIVDESALYHALLSGKIAAAGLDVWWNYPGSVADRKNTTPSNFPFHQLENVVMSPHRAGATRISDKLRYERIAACLNTLVETGFMPNKVNLRRGY